MRALPFADSDKGAFTLPADEAATQKYAFLGRSGSGKSYGAMKLAELLLDIGAQVIALDWVGVWWSLRVGRDGKSSGYPHLYIFGGEHADVPLEPTSGALIADLVVDKHISVVLDLMHFRKAERTRFATAFAEQFFHRKKTKRSACHLFIEEAQAYLPQNVRGSQTKGADSVMLGVFEDIGKVGRNYGIGNTLISQRPQAINKDVLNQAEVVLAFQTNGRHEREALEEWTETNIEGDSAGQMINLLPTLPKGDAIIWSPQWLRVEKRIHIRERTTYDASSTPTQLKAKRVRPKLLDASELDQLGENIRATIEKAKADDPAELKAQIAKLKAQLSKAEATVAPPEKPRPALKQSQIANLEKIVARLERTAERMSTDSNILIGESAKAREVAMLIRETIAPAPARALPAMPGATTPSAPRASTKPITTTAEGITPAQQKILNALLFMREIGIGEEPHKDQLAVFVGAPPTSGGYFNNLGRLNSLGLIHYPRPGYAALTPEGMRAASKEGIPRTRAELLASFQQRVSPAQWKIVEELVRAYPKEMHKSTLAEKIGVPPTSGGYFNNLGRLKTLGMIEYPVPGAAKASPLLFQLEA